jgi:hypothetical protein
VIFQHHHPGVATATMPKASQAGTQTGVNIENSDWSEHADAVIMRTLAWIPACRAFRTIPAGRRDDGGGVAQNTRNRRASLGSPPCEP